MKVTKEIVEEAANRFAKKVASVYEDTLGNTYIREKMVTMEEGNGSIVISYALDLPINHLRPDDGSKVEELWRHKVLVPQEVEILAWRKSEFWFDNERIHFRREWSEIQVEVIKTSGAGNGWEDLMGHLQDILFEESGLEREMAVEIPWVDREFSKSGLSWLAKEILINLGAGGLLTPKYEIYLRHKGIVSREKLIGELEALLKGMVPSRTLGSPHQVEIKNLMNLRVAFGRGYVSVLWAIKQIGMVAHKNQEKYPRVYWNSRQAGMDMAAQWAIENRSEFWAIAVRGRNYREIIRLAAPDVYKNL